MIANTALTLELSGTPDVQEVSEYVRPDQFVFRLSPDESVTARVYATNLGAPLANATVYSVIDTSVLTSDPPGAIDFPATVATGADGVAKLTISGSDPSNPRGYTTARYTRSGPRCSRRHPLRAGMSIPGTSSACCYSTRSRSRSRRVVPALQPIFQQYANLYPVMQGFLDLSDYDSVVANRQLLLMAFRP